MQEDNRAPAPHRFVLDHRLVENDGAHNVSGPHYPNPFCNERVKRSLWLLSKFGQYGTHTLCQLIGREGLEQIFLGARFQAGLDLGILAFGRKKYHGDIL